MEERHIGVGPHPKPWPDDSRFDRELLKSGDKRNVIDKYRYWSNDAIVADMNKTSVALKIAVENWQHDFNIGSIVRTANAFNVDSVHIIGKKQWNKRGAMVTNRYLRVVHHKNVRDFVDSMKEENYHLIAVDILPGAVELSTIFLPEKTVLIFGGEGPGLSDEMLSAAEQVVQVEQFGSTRSVNVGVAAGITMYRWLQDNTLTQNNK